MNVRVRDVLAAAVGCGSLLAAVGCANYEVGRVQLDQARDFAAVSSMLGARCGSLDCHGRRERPLRLYSGRGLRLAEDDLSGHGGTRAKEHAANLQAVRGLEPELWQRVLEDAGEHAQRLLLVRKATGVETHAPGCVLEAESDGLGCLVGWLAGIDDETRCEAAADWERP